MSDDGDMTRWRPVAAGSRLASGLAFAVVSAATFGLSGPLAAAAARLGVEPRRDRPGPGRRSPRSSCCRSAWSRCAVGGSVLRRNAGLVAVYGVLAVAGAQFCYFSAVAHMQVGPALLIEYTAPAAVVVLACGCATASAPAR